MRLVFRIIGAAMFVGGVAFLLYALRHPESGFPIPLKLTYILYAVYVIVMLVFLLAPFKRKK